MKVMLKSKFKSPVTIDYKPYKTMTINPNEVIDISEQVYNNYSNMFMETDEVEIPLFDDGNVIVETEETEEIDDNIIDTLFINDEPKRKKK